MKKQILAVVLIAISMTLTSSCFKGQWAITIIAQKHMSQNTPDLVLSYLKGGSMADLRTGLPSQWQGKGNQISSKRYTPTVRHPTQFNDTEIKSFPAGACVRVQKTEFKEINDIGTDFVIVTILIVAYAFWMILKSFRNSPR